MPVMVWNRSDGHGKCYTSKRMRRHGVSWCEEMALEVAERCDRILMILSGYIYSSDPVKRGDPDRAPPADESNGQPRHHPSRNDWIPSTH